MGWSSVPSEERGTQSLGEGGLSTPLHSMQTNHAVTTLPSYMDYPTSQPPLFIEKKILIPFFYGFSKIPSPTLKN